MREYVAMLCAIYAALFLAVEGNASLLARPPLGKRTGFIVNTEGAAGNGDAVSPATSTGTETPSFVSVGIRSGCAREKAATLSTLRSKDTAGTSAASRLRGGSSWIPHPPAKLSRAELEQQSHPPKIINNVNPVSSHRPSESSSCKRVAGGGSSHGGATEFTVSKQRMTDDKIDSPYEDEAEPAIGGLGGGGGGGRVGSLPSFPRTLPATNSKAPPNKKFAWVP